MFWASLKKLQSLTTLGWLRKLWILIYLLSCYQNLADFLYLLIILRANIVFVLLCRAMKTVPDFPDPSFLPISKSSTTARSVVVRLELVEEKVYNLSSFVSCFLERWVFLQFPLAYSARIQYFGSRGLEVGFISNFAFWSFPFQWGSMYLVGGRKQALLLSYLLSSSLCSWKGVRRSEGGLSRALLLEGQWHCLEISLSYFLKLLQYSCRNWSWGWKGAALWLSLPCSCRQLLLIISM